MSRSFLALFAVTAVAALAGCRGQTSKETPIFGIRNMYDQPRYDVQEESKFFPDHRTMRPLVEGVIAHDEEIDPQIARGRLEDESGYVMEIPQAVVARSGGMQALVQRGKDRYAVFCTPCHDGTGSGEGLVKRRAVASGAAAFVPPTFHQDRVRHMPDGQLFATITNGKSNMPPYAMQLKVDDRWAIVGYVRALQASAPKPLAAAPLAPTAAPGGTTAPPPGGPTAAPADGDHGDAAAPAPATSDSAAPATSGSAAPATSGSAAPAAPATSGSAAPATSGAPHAAPPGSAAPSGAAAPAAPTDSHPQEKNP